MMKDKRKMTGTQKGKKQTKKRKNEAKECCVEAKY
jgi:hypothetical protein